MVQGTQGMHKGAWNTPLESAGTTEWTPASVERVTKARVAQQGGRDEAAKACSGGRLARFRWLDVITLVTRAFTSEEWGAAPPSRVGGRLPHGTVTARSSAP